MTRFLVTIPTGSARSLSRFGCWLVGPGWATVWRRDGVRLFRAGLTMGELMVDEPAFAAAVAELEPVFSAELGFRCGRCWRVVRRWSALEHIQQIRWRCSWR